MLRPLIALPVILLLAGCSGFEPSAPRPEARDINQQDQVSLRVACREAADRTLSRQDRGQLMREDERNARLGSESGAMGLRTQSDQLGRQFRRDRLAADCERQNQRGAPDLPQAAATPTR